MPIHYTESLIFSQMMRVISSPSNSTTGLATLILDFDESATYYLTILIDKIMHTNTSYCLAGRFADRLDTSSHA